VLTVLAISSSAAEQLTDLEAKCGQSAKLSKRDADRKLDYVVAGELEY
jgi:hypothetical protein